MPESVPELSSRVGDFSAAFAAAPVQVDETYTTPDQAHAMMEPHATLAAWDDDELTLWTSVQIIEWARRDLSKILGMPAEKIRVVTPFIGGGFGGKLIVLADAVLASVGSRVSGRPVRIALPRPLLFNNTTHRPATIQRVRMGADREGRIVAIGHERWSGNLPGGHAETAVDPRPRSLYAGANRMLRTRLADARPAGRKRHARARRDTRHDGLGDRDGRVAEKLGLDPVELRIRNDTQVDPEKPERRFSTRRFADCLRLGAERFGWERRVARPAAHATAIGSSGRGSRPRYAATPLTPQPRGSRLAATAASSSKPT